MATGYEQVRSVVAELAGDHAGARNVQLVLPETGVCSSVPQLSEPAIGCCGGPAPAAVDACCVADAKAKDAGKAGCGCGPAGECRDGHGTGGMTRKATWPVIWALGVTQIVGYGTLYYSYSILAPAVAQNWLRLCNGFSACFRCRCWPAPCWRRPPAVGPTVRRRPADGAGLDCRRGGLDRLCLGSRQDWFRNWRAYDGSRVLFRPVQHRFRCHRPARWAESAAQHRPFDADRRLCVDAVLAAHYLSARHLGWREILLVLPGSILSSACRSMPGWRFARARVRWTVRVRRQVRDTAISQAGDRSPLFWLMLFGFAIEGFVLSAILVHMVPLTAAVGLGTAGVFVASLFGPSQVASRFINMLFGRDLRQTWLAVIATLLLAAGVLVLVVSAPSLTGAAAFASCSGSAPV